MEWWDRENFVCPFSLFWLGTVRQGVHNCGEVEKKSPYLAVLVWSGETESYFVCPFSSFWVAMVRHAVHFCDEVGKRSPFLTVLVWNSETGKYFVCPFSPFWLGTVRQGVHNCGEAEKNCPFSPFWFGTLRQGVNFCPFSPFWLGTMRQGPTKDIILQTSKSRSGRVKKKTKELFVLAFLTQLCKKKIISPVFWNINIDP